MVINLTFEICSPTVALALTGGPVQAELLGFEPAGTSEMVDLFTGDFKYNIPLLDVDGYPVNLAYRAGQNMESEASWVGLGWSLNPGVMNRMVKGLPDDFDGDNIYSETNIKPHRQVGTGYQFTTINNSSLGYYNIGATHSYNLSFGALLTYNNYTGHSLEAQFEVSSSYGIGVSAGWFTVLAGSIGKGNGFKISTSEGVTKTDYGIKSYAIFQGNNTLELSRVNSTNIGTGTMINTRTGATYDLSFGSYSSNTIEELGGIWTSSSGIGGSALVPTSHLSHNPSINHSFSSIGNSESSKWGIYVCGSVFFFTGEHGFFLGRNKYNLETALIDKTKNLKSYGYMNLENANENALMDFNRFKDGVYMEDTPNGPYSALTNDVFSSTAQGMSANFRPMRSDYGIVHDPKTNSNLLNTFRGKELGLGGFYYRVKNFLLTWGGTSDGNWSTSPINNNLKFYKPDPTTSGDRLYEKAFFKVMGEPTPVNQAFENDANGENPVAASFVSIGGVGVGASNPFSGASSSPSIKRSAREIRNTHISYLNATEADEMGLVKGIKDFKLNDFDIDQTSRHLAGINPLINRKAIAGSSNTVDHHLSEVTVTRNDGSRYIYGIPVYNKLKKNVVFNASECKTNSGTSKNLIPLNPDCTAPLKSSADLKMIQYTNAEVSHSNERGMDNYYHAEWIPAYAQSFLLTAIISSDYVDLTGDGPSSDDLGNYTLFNYTKTNEYKWRNPYCAPTGCPTTSLGTLTPNTNHAILDEGFRSDEFDDKAMYEYGTRDNWYLHSIETKNHVAEFEIDLRDDNCGVTTEDGGVDVGSSYLLKQIRLYTKEEKVRAKLSTSTPTPIKTVTFEYDYSLCKDVFNNKNAFSGLVNKTGKLTLKKVFFTYGNSNKASLSPYLFTYADNDHNGVEDANPDYHPRSVDRWGNYKPTGSLDNIDFPYAEQNQTLANQYASSWNLTSIITPSGAKTDVYYEADDYSYVQDETSGTMLKIARLYTSLNPSTIDISAIGSASPTIYNANYMVVDLSRLNKGISTTLTKPQADLIVSKNMFPTNKEMYFKCKTLLAYNGMYPNLIKKDYWDYVPGYTPIEEAGIIDKGYVNNTYNTPEGTFYKYAWVKLKPVNAFSNVNINPISSAGWDLLKTHMPRLAWPGSEPLNTISSASPLQTLTALISSLGVAWIDHKAAMAGIPNARYFRRKYAKDIDYTSSWIRAYNPYKKKIGGNHRVKQIITNDNWNNMLSQYNSSINENSSTYGQKFEYTTLEGGVEISSGVASYEPMFGGDENTMHQPIKFNVNHEFAPNDHYFQETPYLESLYPAALVGYSKVTAKNIDHEILNSTSTPDKVCQIGKTVYEFYTTKDFPFIEKTTGAFKASAKSPIIDDYTVIPSVTYIEHLSQGWTVKFNDMHGKVKKINLFGEDNSSAPISGVSYFYKSSPLNPKGGKQLLQKVSAINENLTVSNEVIGRNIDVTTDLRESLNQTTSFGWNDYRTFSVCNPLGKGNITFINGNTSLGLRTAAITKVVQQYGILEKIESFNSKAKVTTENILWDKNSGEVLLTKTTNNLNQPVYSFNYPAYWMYPNMGNKFERDGLVYKVGATSGDWDLSSSGPNTGELDATAVNNIIKPGDEVYVYDASGAKIGEKFWIVPKKGSSPLKYYAVDANALVLDGSFPGVNAGNDHLIKIIRPIERNQQAFKAGSVVTLNNSPAFGISTTQKVINSTATEYCEIWDIYKGVPLSAQQVGVVYPSSYDPTLTSGGVIVNPYSAGQLGNWRPWRTFLYNTERDYSSAQPDVKTDGTYTSYLPFWNHIATNDWQPIYNTTIAPSTGSPYENWVLHNENTMYSPYGYLLESKDAIGIYHTQRMGFNHTLPILKADNAHLCEVGFDGFEDFGNLYNSFGNASNNPQKITNDHLGFYDQTNSVSYPSGTKPTLDGNNAHTGRQSLSFKLGDKVKLVHDAYPASFLVLDKPVPRCTPSNILTLNKLNLINDKYVVSFWIKSKALASDYSGVFTFNVVSKDNSIVSPPPVAATITLDKTAVINGWQKFEYVVNIAKPSNDLSVEISLEAPSTSQGFYLDDFRIQPYNSSMNTIVYDPVFLRVWAQLDDRNFATIYEYDNAGTLVRTKKETIKGVYTINEVRKSIKK